MSFAIKREPSLGVDIFLMKYSFLELIPGRDINAAFSCCSNKYYYALHTPDLPVTEPSHGCYVATDLVKSAVFTYAAIPTQPNTAFPLLLIWQHILTLANILQLFAFLQS